MVVRVVLRALSALVMFCAALPALAQPVIEYPIALAVSGPETFYLADRNLPGIWQHAGGTGEVFFEGQTKYRTPLNGVRCLAIDRDGKLLAGDSATRQVYRFDDDGTPHPLATPAGQQNVGAPGIPMGLAVNDQNEIFIADLEFHCIWKLPPEGGDPSLFAEVPAPVDIAADSQQHLWVVSRDKGAVRRFAPDGAEQVIVRNQPFNFPHGIAVDPEQRAYVVDGYARCVWRIIKGEPPQRWVTHERFVNPVDIQFHADQLYVVDPRALALFVIGLDGSVRIVELASP